MARQTAMAKIGDVRRLQTVLVTAAAATVAVLITLLAGPAFAGDYDGYVFEDDCKGVNTEEIEDPRTPNAMIMLDKSGSMGWSHWYPQESGTALWDVAVEAIDKAGESLDDDVRLGLGYFPHRQRTCRTVRTRVCNWRTTCTRYWYCPPRRLRCTITWRTRISCTCRTICIGLWLWRTCYTLCTCRIIRTPVIRCYWYQPPCYWRTRCTRRYVCSWRTTRRCSTTTTSAAIIEESDDNNHSTIMSHLNSDSPSGGTPTAEGIEETANSASLNPSDDRPSGGIVITDGHPTTGRSAAVNAACDARDDGHLMYMVGLGGNTDQDFNNKLAAAMGTGCCDSSGTCDPDDGVGPDDPCDTSVSKYDCEGAYEADDPQELENVLMEIGGELSCTFELDTSHFDDGEAPDDPDAVNVQWTRYGDTETIDHRSQSSDGEGWYFPSSQSTDEIALTSDYCDKIRGGDGVEEITTESACECQIQDGDPCDNPNAGWGECPDGDYSCEDAYHECDPVPLEECEEDCPNMDNVIGETCHVDNADDYGPDPDGVPTSPYDPEDEITRCNVGTVACDRDVDGAPDNNEPTCVPYGPMPEMCDGLDNSCDGNVDNITSSWTDWYEGDGEFSEDGGASGEDNWTPDGTYGSEDHLAGTCWERDECLCETDSAEHRGEVSVDGSVEDEFASYMDDWDGYPAGCYCDVDFERD